MWKLKAPAYRLGDAPAAFHRSLKRYLLDSELSMKCVGLRRQASTFVYSLPFGMKGRQSERSPPAVMIFQGVASQMF